jgi:alkylated DNA nucleotide flippase Atl1
MADDDYAEAVLDLVAAIPPGRAMTYGLVAEVVAERLGRGGPRQVGHVLAQCGGGVPWWRVVNASGAPPAPYARDARERWHDEGTPLTADGARVALRRAVWWPADADPAER